ncbi:outer membrane lipoprotein-sorting protein [Candidatus Poribacteria bacterium]|nr:outer membrane lipoprotein-sorting protein [Candidatus Poribacteria bacterium]
MEKSQNGIQAAARNLIIYFSLLSTFSFCMFAPAQESTPDIESLITHIDQLYRSETSHADMEMQIVTPHWERTLAMTVWSKGMDKTFIRITAPKKEQGVATLRIGNEMWNYLPKTNKTMKIPPSMMMGSWMGSDFTNDDLVRESSMLEDYTYQFVTPEDAAEDHLYVELVPKEDSPIVWGKIVAAMQSSDYTPVWQRFYDEKGNLMRVMNFKEIKTFGGKTLPSVVEIVPQNKEGHKTIVRWMNATFDSDVDDKIFTRRNLQRRR